MIYKCLHFDEIQGKMYDVIKDMTSWLTYLETILAEIFSYNLIRSTMQIQILQSKIAYRSRERHFEGWQLFLYIASVWTQWGNNEAKNDVLFNGKSFLTVELESAWLI